MVPRSTRHDERKSPGTLDKLGTVVRMLVVACIPTHTKETCVIVIYKIDIEKDDGYKLGLSLIFRLRLFIIRINLNFTTIRPIRS